MASSDRKKHGFEHVGILYILALSGIAMVIILGHWYIQRYISRQEYDAHLINLAGRQRMLSQQISKIALQTGIASHSEKRKAYAEELEEALSVWQKSQEGLLYGNMELLVTGEKSRAIDSMYKAVTPYYTGIMENATALLQTLRQHPETEAAVLQPYIMGIINQEASFLKGMDHIVFQYDEEARNRVLYLKTLELVWLGITLLIILLVLFFIFRPTARQIKYTMQELIRSEKLAKDMAREMGVLYSSLENSYQELAEVDVVEEPPVLFGKAAPSGDFTYVAEQLHDVLSYDMGENNRNVFSWLQQQGYGQDHIQNIEQMITEGKPWNGEVKATSEEGDFIWLDMNIVPVLNEIQQVEVLNIICTDKTGRKEAEARSHEITREKIEKKVKEQRFRSILILEGQEEERRRISRDIHDGIGQLLTALKFKIEAINLAPDMPEREHKVGETKALLDQVIREVRRVSFNLNPSALSDYGLGPVTKRFCAEASRLSDKKVIFENRTGFINRMDKSVETNLYRIIQEAVNNAIKYAQAEEIRVIFSHKAHYLNVEIADNGVGFDYQQYLERENIDGTGLGIFNMQERSSFINGTFEIRSAQGAGTRINIHLPINGRKHGNYQSYIGG